MPEPDYEESWTLAQCGDADVLTHFHDQWRRSLILNKSKIAPTNYLKWFVRWIGLSGGPEGGQSGHTPV